MRALAALVLVLATPVAAACSLAGPVPAPGSFTLLSEDGSHREIAVHGRLLGAMCELSNRHDLAGDLFAWVEVERHVSNVPWDVHVLDLARLEEIVIRDVARAHIEALGVHDRTVLAYWRDWSLQQGARSFVAIDVDTRERRELPFPPADYVSVGIEGHVVAALSREDGEEYLTVWDDRERRFLREREAIAAPTWLRSVGDEWLAFDGPGPAGGLRAQRVEGGPVEPFGDTPWLVDVDGRHAYLQEGMDLRRIDLVTGAVEPLTRPNGTLVSVHGGVMVLGDYSARHLHALGPLWWVDEYKVILAGVAIFLASFATLPVWWRRMRG